MRTRARHAYSLTVASFLAFFTGWVMPFWFGRFYESTRSKKQWSLFYVIICKPGNCTNVAGILKNDNVDFGGASSPVRLEAISILATITLAMSLLSLVIVLMFHCHVCGRRYSYHNYVTSAVIVQFIAATFAFLTIILAALANGVFFSNLPLDDVIEFPWSLLFFCIGEVLLIASAVIYLLITCKWKKYRHVYAKKRYILDPYDDRYYRYSEPLPDYTLDSGHRYKPYNRDSFVGYFRGRHEDRRPRKLPLRDDEIFVLDRNPWEKRRHYYTYPHKSSFSDYSLGYSNYDAPYNTLGYDFRPERRNHYTKPVVMPNSRLWHTAGSWGNSPHRRRELYSDVYM